MKDSHIQWTDHTINLWWGCTKISPGCAHCYADSLAHRFGKDVWGPGKPREDHRESATKTALKLNKQAEKEGRRFLVFSASMSDWLDDEVPTEWLADLLSLIHATPNLDWLLLTKRPQNWRTRVSQCVRAPGLYRAWVAKWLNGEFEPQNVWIGTTIEDQARADERIPCLLAIPARVRFLSCEPLLESVNLGFTRAPRDEDYRGWSGDGPIDYVTTIAAENIHWVICGGESGGKSRPMAMEWARSLHRQCEKGGAAFFMKQLGGVRDARGELDQIPEDLRVRQFPARQ